MKRNFQGHFLVNIKKNFKTIKVAQEVSIFIVGITCKISSEDGILFSVDDVIMVLALGKEAGINGL